MRTETRERMKLSLKSNHGGTEEITDTDYPESNGNYAPQNIPFTSLRSQHASNSGDTDRLEPSTGAHSHRPPRERRVKEVISLHEQRSKLPPAGAPGVLERSNGRRVSDPNFPKIPAAGGSRGGSFRRDEPYEFALANPHAEIQPASPPTMPLSKDAVKYMDQQVLRKGERRASHRPPPKANGDVPAGKEMRRSSSFSKLGDLAKSFPSISRRQSFSNSRPVVSSGRPSRTDQPAEPRPYARSSSTLSERRGSRGSRSSNNPFNNKLENPRPRSTNSGPVVGSRQSSNEDLEFEFKGDDAGSSNSKRSVELWKPEEEAESAMATAPHAWHDGTNGRNGTFKQEELPAEFGGRLYTRAHSMSHRTRQEDSSDSAGGPKRRSRNSKRESASQLPVSRKESNRNFTFEDPSLFAHKHGSREGGTDGNLKEAWPSGRRDGGMTLGESSRYNSASFRKRPGSSRSGKVAIKGVAAAWYNNGWLPMDGMVPFPDIARLNKFLNDCRSEVEAGVPEKILKVVLGNDTSDLDSIVSTIVYAYFLSCKEESQLFVPVMNMRQEDLTLHTEAVWLFKVTGVDTSNLIFVDQISLQYYHRFGNLKLVLVDHSTLAPHQETLKEAVIEIVDNNLSEEIYSWVLTRDIQEVGSCSTIIAERFAAEAAEHMRGRGLSRLLLAAILLETANLDAKSARCTHRDECIAAFLVNGAGRYGQQGFFRLLRKMKFDISELSTTDMLRKDFKQWKLGPGKTDTCGFKGRVITAAMSTLAVPLMDILNRKDILDDLERFARKSKLDLHLVVTGYYDNSDRYKREILLVPEDTELTQHLITCFSAHREGLKLSSIHIKGLPEEMVVFRQGMVTASRRVLRQILVDYFAS